MEAMSDPNISMNPMKSQTRAPPLPLVFHGELRYLQYMTLQIAKWSVVCSGLHFFIVLCPEFVLVFHRLGKLIC